MSATDPLVKWAFQNRTVPGVALVRCKTGLAVARTGSRAHQVKAAAAIFVRGKARYAARWRCGLGSPDVILLADADQLGGVCPRCIAASAGPAVYRCYSATGELLYIGSTLSRGARFEVHRNHAPWWPELADVQFEDFPSITAARVAERLAIQAEHPRWNRQWAVTS